MTNVIKAIEEKLQAQKDEIFFKEIEIKDLKNQLAAAKAEIKDLESIIAADIREGATK
jgi:predicted  nucleic acid-binding Zn-ribbon protein